MESSVRVTMRTGVAVNKKKKTRETLNQKIPNTNFKIPYIFQWHLTAIYHDKEQLSLNTHKYSFHQ